MVSGVCINYALQGVTLQCNILRYAVRRCTSLKDNIQRSKTLHYVIYIKRFATCVSLTLHYVVGRYAMFQHVTLTLCGNVMLHSKRLRNAIEVAIILCRFRPHLAFPLFLGLKQSLLSDRQYTSQQIRKNRTLNFDHKTMQPRAQALFCAPSCPLGKDPGIGWSRACLK